MVNKFQWTVPIVCVSLVGLEWDVIANAQSMEPSLIASASVTLDGVEHIAKILDVPVREKIVPVVGNVTVLSILVYVRMDGLVTDVIYQTVLEIQTVQIEAFATLLTILLSVQIALLGGWALHVKTFARMELRFQWIVETVFVIRVSLVVDVM